MPDAPLPDPSNWQSLIDGLQSGDDATLRRFFADFGPMLHGIADSRVAPHLRSRFDADDVVQSTFRTFFRRAKGGYFQFEDNQRLWNLLCAITLTKLREKVRFHGRQSRAVDRERSSGATDEGRSGTDFVDSAPAPDAAMEFSDTFTALLEALSEEERQLVDLKLQDLTNDEVAEQLNVSERTVRRSLSRLQEKFEHLLADEG